MEPSQDETPPLAGAHWWTATGHERPVFLDEHGRRRRWVLAAGIAAGVAAALWLTGLLVGAVGFSRLPPDGLPLPRVTAHLPGVDWQARHQHEEPGDRHALIAATRRGPQLRIATANLRRDVDRT